MPPPPRDAADETCRELQMSSRIVLHFLLQEQSFVDERQKDGMLLDVRSMQGMMDGLLYWILTFTQSYRSDSTRDYRHGCLHELSKGNTTKTTGRRWHSYYAARVLFRIIFSSSYIS